MESNSAVPVLRTAESVRETVNQDGAVLLDIKQGLCFSMNPVGAKIWEMLKRQRPLPEIADALESEFHVSRTEIEADISEFVKNLEERNLVLSDSASIPERKSWLSRVRDRFGRISLG